MDGFVRNVVGMQNLEETRRRNDIYEKNSVLQAEQLKVDQNKLKQTTAFRAFDELGKMADHPALATNLDKQADLLLMQGKVMETGLGVKVPLPSKDELMGGFAQTKTLIQAMRGGDQAAAQGALMDAMTANPKWARTVLDDMKKAGELTTQMQELDLKLQTHQAQLEAINVKTGRMKMQEGLFAEHGAALTRVANLAGDPKFAAQFQQVLSFQKPEARQAYLNLPENQAFRTAFEQQIEIEKKDMGFFDSLGKEAEGLQPQKVYLLEQEVVSRSRALSDAQAKSSDGQAPQEQADELKGYEAVRKARAIEAEWLQDPYNKDKWRALKKSEQDLKILQGGTAKKITDLADQRTALAQAKFDQKTQTGLAEGDLQNEFIKGVTNGKGDSQSLGDAIAVVKQKYPGVPFDATKIVNPDKKGKLGVEIKMGQDDVSRQLKMVEAGQGVLDFTKDLRERIEANPRIVGPGAQLATAFAGSAQQLRAIVGMDPAGAQFLNTKTRDEAESFYEILVYLQARSMDASGPLDLKVVEHARDVIGPLSSFSTGPQQVLNKLNVVQANAERNIRRARSHLQGGVKSYMVDPQKPVGELTEEDLLKTILQGSQP
jgi:hypothetical protein